MSGALHELQVTVHYPAGRGQVLLRSDVDWNRDLQPSDVSEDGTRTTFVLQAKLPYRYVKPVLHTEVGFTWSHGANYLVVADNDGTVDVFPHFAEDACTSVCSQTEATSAILGEPVGIRVFHPPGYDENPLRRFPVLYMQDGKNLFSGQVGAGSFSGESWRIAETLTRLDEMSAIEPIIVVGIDPPHRERDYTKPGYNGFGRFMVEELKPFIDATFRTQPGPETTAVMGSSLGAVASFFLGWQWPEVFGLVGCMSGTFGWKDDLFERVEREPKRPLRIYLDSGWPQDNFEMARTMRAALLRRGYEPGRELQYLAFPLAHHDERHWATRSHVPFQFFFGGC